MQIQVVVEKADGGGYVARVPEPFNWTAEATTQTEAIDAIRRRAAAAKVVTVDVPDPIPWPPAGGGGKHLVDPV